MDPFHILSTFIFLTALDLGIGQGRFEFKKNNNVYHEGNVILSICRINQQQK